MPNFDFSKQEHYEVGNIWRYLEISSKYFKRQVQILKIHRAH